MKKFAVMPRLFFAYIPSQILMLPVTCSGIEMRIQVKDLKNSGPLEPGNLKNICDLEFALYNVYKTSESNSWRHQLL